MTTLSKQFDSAAARESEARWQAWVAKGEKRDAHFRRKALMILGWIAAAMLLTTAFFMY